MNVNLNRMKAGFFSLCIALLIDATTRRMKISDMRFPAQRFCPEFLLFFRGMILEIYFFTRKAFCRRLVKAELILGLSSEFFRKKGEIG